MRLEPLSVRGMQFDTQWFICSLPLLVRVNMSSGFFEPIIVPSKMDL